MADPTRSPTPSTSSTSTNPSIPTTLITTPTQQSTSTNSGSGSTPRDRDTIETLKHQLRLSKAEIANLQTKLGVKPNPAPFGSSLGIRRGSELSPPSSHSNRHRSSSPSPDINGRSTSPIPTGLGPVPGTVSSGRVLIDEELGSPPLGSEELPPIASGSGSRNGGGGIRGSLENPFFGSGASGRERLKNSASSAQSGSGKVISGLQSDLLTTKSSLESAKSQLRLSQKAVEFLTRQNEDLKESKERLTTENTNLTKMLSRKERIASESLIKASQAESSLLSLQTSHSALSTTHTNLEKELEGNRIAKEKAESEYGALREGIRTLEDGWKGDLEWLKRDLGKLEAKQRKELDEARLKHETLAKLFKSREQSHTSVSSSLKSLSLSQQKFQKEFEETLTGALKKINEKGEKDEESHKVVMELAGEFRRMRRMIREHGMRTEAVTGTNGG